MLDLALTPNERRAFEAALVDSHRMRVTVSIFDQDEKQIDTLRGKVLSGAVQIDATAAVSRSLELHLLDESRGLRFEPDSPADGAVYADNFIGVTYGVEVAELDTWVDVPVFMGPITLFERNGAEVTVEAQGKESLMLEPHYAGRGYTVRKRTRVDDAIRSIARRAGESRFALPDLGIRLRRSRGVGPDSEPWKVIKGGEETAKGKVLRGVIDLAGGDLEPYYNGRGDLCARRRDSPIVYTFEAGSLLDEPTLRYDVSTFRNTVIVRGGRKGKKGKASGRAELSGSHPLSPRALARNGSPRYLIEWVDVELKTDAKCRRRADATLKRLAREGVAASFNALPVPHLEENDSVTLRTDEFSISFRLSR